MPDTEHGLSRIVPDKGDSPHRRREKVLVIATILLVVLGVLAIMRRGSNAAPDNSASSPDNTGSDYTGGPDASGAGGGGAYGDQLAGQLGAIPEQTAGMINGGLQTQLVNVRTRLRNTQGQLRTARQNRQRATQRANREHRTILRQRAEISKLQHHPSHNGKKNPDHIRMAPHQPKPPAKKKVG